MTLTCLNLENRINSQKLLELCAEKVDNNKTNLIILDIDGTILNNLPRQETIVNKILRKRYKIPKIPTEIKFDYKNYYNILDSIGLFLSDPKNCDIKNDFLEHFLTNNYLEFDILIPGAAKFVKKLKTRGFKIIYLTGRHHSNIKESMRPGTELTLEHYDIGTSKQPEMELKMKPNNNIKDIDFKVQYIEEVIKEPNVNLIAFIDNESEILRDVKKVNNNFYGVRFNGAESNSINYNGLFLDNWD